MMGTQGIAHVRTSPVKPRGGRIPQRAIRASAKRHQEHLQKLQPRHGGGGGRIGKKFNPKRRLGALRRRAGVASEIMRDIYHSSEDFRPAATSPIAHRSPANAQWGRLSTRKLEDELSAKKRLRSESASKKIDDGGELKMICATTRH